MTVLRRRRLTPRTKTLRPAERYLVAGAERARRLGHDYVGTEHVLDVLVHDRDGEVVSVLDRLGPGADVVAAALAPWLPARSPSAKIDAEALAELGIDFENVRARLEQTFGAGALERSRSACLGICPRLKLALAFALDHAGDRQLGDLHVLLGMLSVPDSVAARVLTTLGVTLETVPVAIDR